MKLEIGKDNSHEIKAQGQKIHLGMGGIKKRIQKLKIDRLVSKTHDLIVSLPTTGPWLVIKAWNWKFKIFYLSLLNLKSSQYTCLQFEYQCVLKA